MTIETQPQGNNQSGDEIDFKDRYEAAIGRADHGTMSKACAEKVLDRLMSIKPNSQSTELTKQIQAAAAVNDIQLILSLSKKLLELDENEHAHIEKLASMRSEYSFEQLLSAFPEELQQLAYELAFEVLTATERAVSAKNKRQSGGRAAKIAKSYVISHGDKTIEAMPNTGRPANPGADRDFYQFMGFEVSEDGRTLTPDSFSNKEGVVISMISKKSIIDDLLAGNQTWVANGYGIVEAPQGDKPSEETEGSN